MTNRNGQVIQTNTTVGPDESRSLRWYFPIILIYGCLDRRTQHREANQSAMLQDQRGVYWMMQRCKGCVKDGHAHSEAHDFATFGVVAGLPYVRLVLWPMPLVSKFAAKATFMVMEDGKPVLFTLLGMTDSPTTS